MRGLSYCQSGGACQRAVRVMNIRLAGAAQDAAITGLQVRPNVHQPNRQQPPWPLAAGCASRAGRAMGN